MQTSRTPSRSGWNSALLACCLCWGCGGGSTPTSAPRQVAPPPAPAQVAQQQVAAAAPRLQRNPAPQPAPQASMPQITTEDYLIDTTHQGLEIVPPRTASVRDQFIAFLPAKGSVKNGVSIVPPDQLDEFGQPRRIGGPTLPVPPSQYLPEGFTPLAYDPAAPQGLPQRIRCEADGSEMVLVPAGVSLQGTNDGPPDCAPAHPVYVSSFYIDVNEVTLARYGRMRSKMKEQKQGSLGNPSNGASPVEHPALGVTWKDAERYAQQVGKSLPTEAEWEKAGRGTQSYRYPWGNDRPVWSALRVPGQVDPVGSHHSDQSEYGVFDLAGNAREWCSDWYEETAYENARERDGSPARDWKGPPTASVPGHRVIKGGKTGWELWHRGHASLRESIPDVGFRCVLRVNDSPSETPSAIPNRPAGVRRVIGNE